MCRVCGKADMTLVLDLGVQPWGNNFLRPEQVGHESKYPLRLVFCRNCHTAQLDYTVPKETMFLDHTYVSGTTSTLRKHFADTAREVDSRFYAARCDKSVLDIGSNDGTQLLEYKKLGYDVMGVESCAWIAKQAVAAGVPTMSAFFNESTARRLNRRFNVINASGVFFHLEELHSVTEGINQSLADDGVFVVQFLYMKNIVDNNAFDQIYHEHLLYYNLATIEVLLNRHGLAGMDAYWSTIHGGSIILLATHTERARPTSHLIEMRAAEAASGANELSYYEAFARRSATRREIIRDYVRDAKQRGKTIFGMGAPVKGNTLLNYCQIGPELLDCLVERNPARSNLFSPGMHIPIVLESDLKRQPDIYFVLAWNFRKEILVRYAALVKQGIEFYFPVLPKDD